MSRWMTSRRSSSVPPPETASASTNNSVPLENVSYYHMFGGKTPQESRQDSFPRTPSSVEPPRLLDYLTPQSPPTYGPSQSDHRSKLSSIMEAMKPQRDTQQHSTPTKASGSTAAYNDEDDVDIHELEAQAEIIPPVRQSSKFAPLLIDHGISTAQGEDKVAADSSAWGSAPEVIPPVDRQSMCTPPIHGSFASPPPQLPPLSTQTPTAGTSRISQTRATSSAYDVHKPTCSLNLVCYRGGSQGCTLRQVHAILASRFEDETEFQNVMAKNNKLIATDRELFRELKRLYWGEMTGFVRKWLSLKTLMGLRLLEYSPTTRPTVVPLDDFVLQEMYYVYQNPKTITTSADYIEWVFRLRRPNKRHALEFVEGWNSRRIIVAGTLPWVVSCLIGAIWSFLGGDTQSAFTVAGFILSSGTIILGVAAVISGIESSGRSVGVGK
ncbi:hypothetical protein CC80DRAFT_530871 [Byssothecium circinans]|uniref:Uncharacterized protein n=1 Tax=Byssothecium circinans TaxID=147558 RepID=A0A6A5UDL4_9PLEO|nr:hypothetical protein CC80DRAFT_530871 [Byssothecium circinans]